MVAYGCVFLRPAGLGVIVARKQSIYTQHLCEPQIVVPNLGVLCVIILSHDITIYHQFIRARHRDGYFFMAQETRGTGLAVEKSN